MRLKDRLFGSVLSLTITVGFVNYVDAGGVQSSLKTPKPIPMAQEKILISSEVARKNGLELCSEAGRGRVDKVRQLIQWGFDVNYVGESYAAGKHTPLSGAVSDGHAEVVALLLENGANPNFVGSNGCTHLHRAAYNGHIDIVKLLIEYGADVYARTANYGRTPFISAIYGGNLQIAKMMLAASEGEMDLFHPLYSAVDGGNFEIVTWLLDEHGVNVNHQPPEDQDYMFPLCLAVMKGRSDIVEVLLQHNANVNVQYRGFTPLQLAQQKGYDDIATLLRGHQEKRFQPQEIFE